MSKNQSLLKLGYHRLGGASLRIQICAALPEHVRAMTREVNSLQTDPDKRRQGYATTLMHAICREADLAGITLVLFPEPYKVSGSDDAPRMDIDDLVVWYNTNFGFQVIQHNPKLMARAVQSTPQMRLRLSPLTAALIESVKK